MKTYIPNMVFIVKSLMVVFADKMIGASDKLVAMVGGPLIKP